jgi:hypothetical protein
MHAPGPQSVTVTDGRGRSWISSTTPRPLSPARRQPRRTIPACACRSLSSSSMRVPIRMSTSGAAADLADRAAATGTRLIALPEYLQFRGSDDGSRSSARPIPGPFTEPFADVARRHGVWVLAGSLARRARTQSDRSTPRPDRTGWSDRGAIPEGAPVRTWRSSPGRWTTESARVMPVTSS